MKVPVDLIPQAEDIRHFRHTQLSVLSGISASNFPRWDQGHPISERSLTRIAMGLNTSKPEVLHGFELRRQDCAIARTAQAKADQLIDFLGLNEEPQSA